MSNTCTGNDNDDGNPKGRRFTSDDEHAVFSFDMEREEQRNARKLLRSLYKPSRESVPDLSTAEAIDYKVTVKTAISDNVCSMAGNMAGNMKTTEYNRKLPRGLRQLLEESTAFGFEMGYAVERNFFPDAIHYCKEKQFCCTQCNLPVSGSHGTSSGIRFECKDGVTIAGSDHILVPFCGTHACGMAVLSALEEFHACFYEEVKANCKENNDKLGLKELKQRKRERIRFCGNCGTHGHLGVDLLACSRCRVIFYCSKECQKTHWNLEHKKVCIPYEEL